MAEKFIHKVSPTLTDDAQYKSVSEIPTSALTQGSTIILYPGEYSAVSGAFDNIAFVGIGDKDDVIVHGFTFANTSANTLVFENMTIKGSNAVATSNTQGVLVNHGTATVSLDFRNVKVSNAEFGVRNFGSGTTKLSFCDFSGVDKAINVASGATTVHFSVLNSSSNAYFQAANAYQATVTVVASRSGGSNVGNTVETVQALIS